MAEAQSLPGQYDAAVGNGMDYAKAKQLFEALEREGVRYVVFDAVALNFHGLARFTEDLDLLIAPERDNIDRLKRALRSVFNDPDIEQITADDLLGEYPAIQYFPPDQTFHVDLLTRLGEAFAFDDLEVSRIPFEGLTISVASPKTLYRMKKNTVRLKDRADAALLRERFGIGDE